MFSRFNIIQHINVRVKYVPPDLSFAKSAMRLKGPSELLLHLSNWEATFVVRVDAILAYEVTAIRATMDNAPLSEVG